MGTTSQCQRLFESIDGESSMPPYHLSKFDILLIAYPSWAFPRQVLESWWFHGVSLSLQTFRHDLKILSLGRCRENIVQVTSAWWVDVGTGPRYALIAIISLNVPS
ncbi:hypothetical protein AC1031_020104 [Aphanomyces cochlioides]|nr:hypothetical protein AC1031_020104 [Aphanomyces cochlioides]